MKGDMMEVWKTPHHWG